MTTDQSPPSLDVLAPALIDAAKAFYRFGWMMGGSGNMSALLADEQVLITPSGCAKNRLTVDQLITVDQDHTHSAEASEDLDLHRLIYDAVDDARAIFHVHHLQATLCSDRDKKRGATHLHDVQMIRGLTGDERGSELSVDIPIAEAATAEAFEAVLQDTELPCVNVYNHGLYVWGRSIDDARSRMEALAYLFQYAWERPMNPKKSTSISGFDAS